MKRSLLLATGFLVAAAAQAQPAATPDSPKAEPAPVYSVVEPKAPAKVKPAARKRAAKANAKAKAPAKPASQPPVIANAEILKPNGPCLIKPVMSDQDLVNCGARPQH